MFMINKPRGERPERDWAEPACRKKRRINEEAALAAAVAPFAGFGVLICARSLLEAGASTALAFVIAFTVFTVLKFIVALPERGAPSTSSGGQAPSAGTRTEQRPRGGNR
jgi:hypothetical protein